MWYTYMHANKLTYKIKTSIKKPNMFDRLYWYLNT